ncbi:AsmA family protein [Bradyrhizobium sp.]|uniref:AsmA family protein n=1 Tax=Bradyrhizobium sp. TaxID=376 RepID=UPI00403813FD
MRTLKIAGAAVVAVIVVIALLLVVGVPSGFLTSAIQERVERETGYKLTINGSTRIGIWPQLNVTLKDVTLADPKDRDITNRLTAASIEADVTLASVWSGKPEITELVIVRPVLSLPLQRERSRAIPAKPVGGAAAAAFSIEHVIVTGGTVVFSNLRDRVESRIEGLNADIIMTDDRKVRITGNARTGEHPLKFDIKATAPGAPLERQNIPTEFTLEIPALLPAPAAGKAEVRLNGSIIQINGLSGMLGDGAFNGWASIDVSSKPLVKLDLDFHRLNVAMAKSTPGSAKAPWSNATIDINGLNYVDAQARISAAQLNLGDTQFAPAAIEANLASGILKLRVANLGTYGGLANGDLTIDASTAVPSYALQTDLTGVRALQLLQTAADFDKLDGKLQAKIAVRSTGNSQRAIMSNMTGTVFALFQDGQIRGLNVAQMIRSLTASTLSGWQENSQQATDLTQLSASFKIDKGQATTYDLNLVGPLVKVTGVGTVDLGTKQMGFRVEPKLVMTTEGQGRVTDPVGFGIPVIIDGPWSEPRIYPEMSGILENPEAAYAKLREMGKGLFGKDGAGLGAAIGGLLSGIQQGGAQPGQQPGTGAGAGQPNALGGDLGATIGNLIQQGLGGLNQPQAAPGQQPQASGQPPAGGRSQGRSIPSPGAGPAPLPQAETASPPPAAASGPVPSAQESQPMNDVLRQLFNR